ncbi:hypothetical protein ABB37_03144 [Leptomonas pyrrhocoris]|uniref:Ankyrin repeat protein n=1 Tax=Leptomonas pyrrhocoris TaxID=157538 RepID=A0A0M9G4A6_LEPPY|nr:hypothetical protein ABB37_03144 [Leptomonas pyrrhocoris]XP_015660396.1 hypothetical protein ABB37_03144 [Leptomonas pyrrhocoris]KPA81956.1 hypothetical protein ABB37_03144 [Leptomonas pyrrhocoris]KPA81957.1 hypothetical protein ABB37_03144 [Leptomonas pyrrhocoris]|eukprot:XP_015660395.1 hypothetical protein ABB37_03144 [Leptomonas pyrrhocoris]
MFSLLRTRRILRCAGRVLDPEALLLSVLKHQSTSLPNNNSLPLHGLPDLREPAQDGIPTANSDAQGESCGAPSSEDYRIFFDCLQSKKETSADSSFHQSPKPTQNFPAVVSQLNLEPLRCSPSQGDAHRTSQSAGCDDLCFTLAAAEADPNVTFPEILTLWESFVEGYGAYYAEQLSPDLRRREAALLNYKLEDPVLGQLAAMKGGSQSRKKTPKYIADVLQLDTQESARSHPTNYAMEGGPSSTPFACYGLLHFSAELGDVDYLHSLFHRFPHGFPLRWLSTPSGFDRDDRFGDGGLFGEARTSSNFGVTGCTTSDSAHQTHQTQGRRTELRSFAQIAAYCPDHLGLYLSHLAGMSGHIAYIAFLISVLGADFVLREQRCVPPISTAYTWGIQRYMSDLNATQCAVAGQQVALLEWIEKEHPHALQKLHARKTLDALMIAAMSKDDSTDILDFFLSRDMPPIRSLLTVETTSASAERVGMHRGVAGVGNQDLQNSGILRLLFAAAEVGNAGVLRWFNGVLGKTDVRQLCDSHGATILHHCARGRNAPLLETLLPASVEDGGAASKTGELFWRPLDPLWVDVEDDQGLTPATWCVMSARRSKDAVDTLEVLRKAGSNWPRQRQNGVSLLDVATRFVSRHSKLARYITMHIQPPGRSTAPPPP